MRRLLLVGMAGLLLAAGCSSEQDVPIDQVKEYLSTNYGSTSWYGSITDVYERSGAVWVDTDMFADSDAAEPAESICSAVSSWELTEFGEFVGVSVRAADGGRLVLRTGEGGSCTADL